MISAATITALEERKLEYILGARERSSAVVRRLVLEDEQPLTPLLIDRVRGETQLFIKEVKLQTLGFRPATAGSLRETDSPLEEAGF
jgi:hypothetical protein